MSKKQQAPATPKKGAGKTAKKTAARGSGDFKQAERRYFCSSDGTILGWVAFTEGKEPRSALRCAKCQRIFQKSERPFLLAPPAPQLAAPVAQ